jgi:capsid protein
MQMQEASWSIDVTSRGPVERTPALSTTLEASPKRSPLVDSAPRLHPTSRYDDGTAARMFEAATDTEENVHQWLHADGRTLNEILVDYRENIINRSIHEARRNPTVEGVIKSHAGDVVGDDGPGLQMLTDDDAWNEQAEVIWKEKAEAIDGSGQLSLGEWLRQDIYQSWVTGDMIAQIVEPRRSDYAIRICVNPISGARLKSPYTGRHDHIMLGVERDPFNRPIRYYFEDEIRSEYGYKSHVIRPIPARDILHFFEQIEPGQAVGYPKLASCLQAVSDLREFDNFVMGAAKVQAMMHVVMSTMSDMAELEDNPDPIKLKNMGVTKIPKGWEARALQTSQPNTNNTEFRDERIRELGRPAGMPLMQIRLDSSGHNYSSARFDAQTYNKACKLIQGSIARHRVRPLVMLVLYEAMSLGLLPPKTITKAMISFRWPQPPHVDPVKEAMAERIRLENRTLSPQTAAASHNMDFDKIVHDWDIANKLLQKHGMPPLLGGIPTDLNALANFLGMNNEGADNATPNRPTT